MPDDPALRRFVSAYARVAGVLAQLDVTSSLPSELPEIEMCDPDQNLGRAQDVTLEKSGQMVIGPKNVVILMPGASLKNCRITMKGRGNVIVIGPSARLTQVNFQTTGRSCMIVVGAETTWESGAAMSGREDRSIVVGSDCMFSNGVVLRTSDAHGIFDMGTKERINEAADVVIGDHVWLGSGVRVGKGTSLGPGSVVGQSSLVNGTLEGHTLYAGVPARKLRDGITWSRTQLFDDVPERFKAE